jgi:nucleotide-binding universal stress UspA family protein
MGLAIPPRRVALEEIVMFKRILVAVDDSAPARHGLEAAAQLAADQRAVLLIVHVVDELSYLRAQYKSITAPYVHAYAEALRVEGRKVLDDAKALARSRRVAHETVLALSKGASVARTILAQARALRADVIVLGTHGRRGVERLLLGSDAEAVLRESPIPVLTVRVHEPVVARTAPPALTQPRRQARRNPPHASGALRIESWQ